MIYWRLLRKTNMQRKAIYKINKFLPRVSKYCNYLPDETILTVYYGLIKMIGAELHKTGFSDCPDLGTFFTRDGKPRRYLDVRSRVLKMMGPKKQVRFSPCRKIKAHFRKIGEEEARTMI